MCQRKLTYLYKVPLIIIIIIFILTINMKNNSAKMYKNEIFEIDYIDFCSIIIVQTNQLIHQHFWLIFFSFIIEVKFSRHFNLMVFFHKFNYFQF